MSSKKIIDLRRAKSSARGSTRVAPTTPQRARRTVASDVEVVARPGRAKPLRVRRRRARMLTFLTVVLVTLLAAGIVSYLSYLPKFSVQSVAVVGAQDVPTNEVTQYVLQTLNNEPYTYISSRNIFNVPRKVLEQGIVEHFPRVESAVISRASLWSTELTITVHERQPYALWCAGVDCYLMDTAGYVYAPAPSPLASDVPSHFVFGGGLTTGSSTIGQRFATAHLPGIIALLSQLGQAGLTPTGASVENDSDISAHLSGGAVLLAAFGEDPATVIHNLQLALSTDALRDKLNTVDYIDLRFGDKVYYKLKGGVSSTATTTKRTQ